MRRLLVPSILIVTSVVLIGMAKTQTEKPEVKPAEVAVVGEPAPDFTCLDATGEERTLSDYRKHYVVLEWVNFGCPFVRKHYSTGNMQALQSNYTQKDVVWLSICSSAPGRQGYMEGEKLTSRLEEEGSQATAYLVDADGTVGRRYDAKTTPHMFVIDPNGKLIYAGAIDDRPSTKPEDVEGAKNYIGLALEAALADQEVSTSATKSYGCSVKYAR
jgi:peroxiredoxin